MTARTHREPRLLAALYVLTFVTGMVDAVSVLGLGRVFVANMTGNIAFLGFAAVGTPGFQFAPLLAALLFFLLGALVAGRLLAKSGEAEVRWSRHMAIEPVLLAAAAAVATGFDPRSLATTWQLYVLIALTGMAMGYRNATVRHLKVADLTTTVLTLTLTGLAAESTLAGGTNLAWQRRLASVVALGLGAAAGAALFAQWGIVVPLTASAMLAFLAAAICRCSGAEHRA